MRILKKSNFALYDPEDPYATKSGRVGVLEKGDFFFVKRNDNAWRMMIYNISKNLKGFFPERGKPSKIIRHSKKI